MQTPNNQNVVIAIQGNLGAGKSTYLSFLAKKFSKIQIIRQPVDEWQNIGGYNLLDVYYKDSKRWSFTFQTFAIMSRMKLWKSTLISQEQNKDGQKFKFSQRSMMADRFIFGELMNDLQNVEPIEFEAYKYICNQILDSWPVHAIIYLKCKPETCLNRIKRRSRTEEEAIPLSYLDKVDQKYTKMLADNPNIRMLEIDTEELNVQKEEDQKIIYEMVKKFLEGL